jgi:arylsulfatase A-like enzyme
MCQGVAVSDTPRIGTSIAESTPAFDPLPRPPDGAPNVVMIVLDDLGFAQLGCFGGDVDTPNIDALAAEGLRYRQFHVTAICSPTRACLLTGRNHHAVGMGFLVDLPLGFPGYSGRIPATAPTLPRVLRSHGYSTFAVGKWHLAPRWEQSVTGPFDRWPLGLGFQRYYGFLGGDTNQWTPDLVCDNHVIEPPRTPAEGYHLTEDLVDQARRMILDQQQATPGTPFLLYFAPGAMHAPHHAPREWIERFRGRYDDGWETWREQTFRRQVELGVVPEGTLLPERPPWVSAWEELDPDRRAVSARMMEVYAAFLAHTDHHLGRLLGLLDELGLSDNTIVMLLSDNGTSAEGGPLGSLNEHRFTHDQTDDPATLAARIDDLGGFRAYNHYPWGWAWAGNTPFRLWKRYTWLGGVRTPLIIRWPARITAAGEVRSTFCHAIDLMPTILDAVGVDAGSPLDGASLVPSFHDPAQPGRSTQYFEMAGSRALYHEGWKVTTDHIGNQLSVEREQVPGSHDFDDDHWALFDLTTDASESIDLAAEHPDRVAAMIERWWEEARRNQVLPLDDSLIIRAIALEPNPYGTRSVATFRPGGGPVAEDLLPPMGGGFLLRATVTGSNGVICALGDWNNGFALYLRNGQPSFCVNLFGDPYVVTGERTVDGPAEISVSYQRQSSGGGPMALSVDGVVWGTAELPADLPFRWQIGGGGLLVGRDRGFPVCDDYEPPFPFDGEITEVRLDALGLASPEVAELVRLALHRE